MTTSSPMKRKVRVTITKEIEVELTPAVFGEMSQEQYLQEFRSGLWHVDDIDDVFRYAAEMLASYGGGYSHDGIGLVDSSGSTHPRAPDVKADVVDEDIETELMIHEKL